MIDKEWLKKIETAYKAYPYPNVEIEKFIQWIYKQYGVVQEKKNGKS